MTAILFGLKACGKTTVGHAVAAQMRCPFVDTDQLIEAHYSRLTQQKKSFSAIYSEVGEVRFREMEREVIAQISKSDPLIIAVGGGALMDVDNTQALQERGQLIYLHLSEQAWIQRLDLLPRLPAFIKNCSLQNDYFNARHSHYNRLAQHTLRCDGLEIMEVVQSVISLLA